MIDDTTLTSRVVSSYKVDVRRDQKICYLRCHASFPKSKKKSTHCTAFMKVIENSTGVHVEHCATHLGHSLNAEGLKLSEDSVNYIVQLLKNGVSPSHIISKIRSKFEGCAIRTRLFYTTIRDIRLVFHSLVFSVSCGTMEYF